MNICLASCAEGWTPLLWDCCCHGDWYIGGFGGYNWTAKNGHRVPPNPVPPSTTTPTVTSTIPLPHFNLHRYKPGYVAGGNCGFAWENGFHLEFEFSYRQDNLKHPRHRHRTNHRVHGYLINAFYQFSLVVVPLDMYFGGGLGYSETFHVNHRGKSINDRNGFAWQFLGGLAYPICNRLDITAEYRYFTEQRAKFRNSSANLGFRFYL